MKIQFSKYHGTGNDFILIDNRKADIKLSQDQVSFLCHRRYGIGSDGLMLLQNSDQVDFEMIYYNSDGKIGTMCGNGGRCLIAFANHLKVPVKVSSFTAIDGVHDYKILHSGLNTSKIKVKLLDVRNIEKYKDYYFLNTGSPHYVKFVKNIDELDIYAEGKKIRWNKSFQPLGTNVNFAEIKKDCIDVRTFERGVEDVTLSCGTGVTAAAITASMESNSFSDMVKVNTKGGELNVHFKKRTNIFQDVWLEGPATRVYSGNINIE